MAAAWGITEAQFIEYNPSVGADCSGFVTGAEYCLEVNNGQPTTTIPTTTPNPTTTTTPAPSPTQDGLTKDCTSYYKVVANDNCPKIVSKYGAFTLEQFLSWNPGLGVDCSSIWVGYYVCVGIPGTPTTSITSTTTTTTPTGPSPTQDGIIASCTKYYKAVSGDTCPGIVLKNGNTFTEQQLKAWNPALGEDCSGIWASYFYCVAVPGTPTTPITTTVTTTTSTPTGPSPTQDGIIASCTKYYKAVSGDTCPGIVTKNGNTFTEQQLKTWNPALGSDCSGIWAGYHYCVAIPGTPTTPITTVTATTTTSSGPSPTQTGIIKTCTKYYKAVSGDSCEGIATKHKTFTTAQFISWNPDVGSTCNTLLVGYFYCIAIPGTPTTPLPTSTIKTTTTVVVGPSPTHSPIASNCNKYYQIKSGDTCEKIQTSQKVTAANLGKWNPFIDSKCTNIWVGYWICVGVKA
ncbi:hypothetical protein BJ508DRAFT_333633 [Ascobolus immersus RN42]|uniref:LysM domain-containing protein n=1 Tax=Ascobolus immersus RN42 TaxID=1160509 RepID=A0A3N4HW27_ASCIM|nr:hypothetical protein BJ508DRAFT_333633 [Ascobolus immersus RN42]